MNNYKINWHHKNIFFKTFSEYENDKRITADMWLHALGKAKEMIEQLEITSINDGTLLHVLIEVENDLENALNTNMNPIDAFAMIVRTAENFAINTVHIQSSHIKRYKVLQSFLFISIKL